MSNNISVTEGAGKTVATEDIGSAQYQKIKVVGGQTGSTSVMGVNPDGSINVSVVGTVAIAGSVIAVVTSNPNQSVSGTIGASIIGYPAVNVGGSVAAFQAGTRITSIVSTVPSSVIVGASIFGQLPAGTATIGAVTAPAGSILSITHPAGSITAVSATAPAGSIMATNQIAGSIMAVSGTITTVTGNSSVMLLNGTNVVGSVAVLQGTNPWTTVRPAGSVTAVANLAGSIAAVSATAPAGSVMATNQVAGSIMAVAGTITTVTGNSSVMLLTSTNVIGSVSALQGTNPWTIVHPAASITSVTFPAGSIATVLATQSGTWATSVVGGPLNIGSILGTYQEETVGGPSIKGIALVWESNASTSVMSTVSPTNPLRVLGSISGAVTAPAGSIMTIVHPAGSVTAVSATAPSGSILSVTNPAGSITAVSASAPAGSVLTIATLAGSIMAVSATAPAGSVIATAQVAGSIMAVSATAPAGSVIATAQVAGSVMAVAVAGTSSVIVVPQFSSVVAILQAASIVGTYAEDTASGGGDKGLFVLGIRNDTVASFVGSDLDYAAHGLDSAGRTLIRPFAAEEARVEGYNSVVSGSVTTLVAAAGAGLRNYITDIIIANTGTSTTLVTFKSGGGSSVLGYTIAPTAGGSNIIGMQTPFRTEANATFDFQATTSTSVLYATVKGFKAP